MKNINKILVIVILGLSSIFSTIEAQSINYKAVIKDGSGNLITNDLIQVQFNILQGVAQTNVYSESHTPTTDTNGVIIVNIGEGMLVSGSAAYNTVDWASNTHFLQVLVNTGGGLIDMGTSEFKAVPYAITSGDKSWETEVDNVHVISKNVGIGTATPTELLEISDPDIAGIKLTVPSISNSSKIEFSNGLETGTHSFYKIENRSDQLRFELDSDLNATTEFESRMTLSNSGLALQTGTRINEFSTDGTLAGNSSNALPTEQAVKTYVDNSIASATSSQKTIIVPATAFTSNNSLVNYGIGGGYAYKPSSNQSIFAPVIIPIGSTVSTVTFYFRDTTNAGSVNLIGDVIAYYRTNTSATIPITVSTFGSSATGIIETSSNAFTIGTDRQYYIRVRPSSNWDSSNLGIHSVKFTYIE
ncbi:hypothetical protein [Lacinutrix sp. Bg11-31]|uniref:hypothetical protein n=1 Tax=Lacinutrix sp. Bg11-31 TaxID=2057808 RepID=UPI000C314A2C|nr:hypothetical protein [Lacinutrix sp. Bg11-31]AUC81197.1 hypothetical protein CW733_03235 [Lacinutrix sp. Bg11-31]